MKSPRSSSKRQDGILFLFLTFIFVLSFQNCSRPSAIQVTNLPSSNSQNNNVSNNTDTNTNANANPSNVTNSVNNMVGTELSKTISFNTVEFSNNHSCGVSLDNKTYCWGKDNYGELGNGTGTQSTDTPNEVSYPNNEFSLDVQVGGNFTCALVTSDPSLKDYTKNKIYCWGYSANGVLGHPPIINYSNGVVISREVPSTAVTFAQPAAYPVQLSGKGFNMCARLSDYTVWCWGQGDNGMLGNSNSVPCNINDPNVTQGGFVCYKKYSTVPVQVKVKFTNGAETTQFQQVLSNSYVSCVRNGVSLFCWGDTYVFGPNIHTANDDHSVPKQIGGFVNFQNIFLGPYSFCMVGVGDGGFGYCRGDSNLGRLGNGLDTATDAKDKEILYNVKSNIKFQYIKPAMSKTCGLTLDNQIYCWGNGGPQKTGLGVKDIALSNVPVLAFQGEKFKNLSCSNNDLCGGQSESGVYIYW